MKEQKTLVDESNDLIEKIEAVKLQKNQDIINIKERRINQAEEATQELMNFIKFQSLDNSSVSNPDTGGPISPASEPKPRNIENNESSVNNEGKIGNNESSTKPTFKDASDIDELLKSCEDLKTNYKHKHEEVLLLGDIITALKRPISEIRGIIVQLMMIVKK